jgi:hypothetical protein
VEWLLLVALAVVVAAVIVVVRRRTADAAPAGTAPEPDRGGVTIDDVLALHPGALICHRGAEYLVERSLTLEVQETEPPRLCVYERLPESATPPEGETLYREGADYAFSERGQAEYRTQERAGAGKRGQMAYVEFEAGRERIAFSCFDDGEWEVARGETIDLSDLELPAG